MYRSCIFCSAALGSNESIERFPVGGSLAFDGEKGRLWAVCPACARWNLAPIEERWEAIEEAERLFRDTRLRAQRENIGLAKLRDGTRLIRIGQAATGELAVWRYGESLVHRRRRYLAKAGPLTVLGGAGMIAIYAGGPAAGMAGMGAWLGYRALRWAWRVSHETKVLLRLSAADSPLGEPVSVFSEHVQYARMEEAEDGGVGIRLPALRHRHEWSAQEGARVIPVPVLLTGGPARLLMNRAMVLANHRGARRGPVLSAVEQVAAAGSPQEYLRAAARDRRRLIATPAAAPVALSLDDLAPATPVESLALEMALHEETERRALDGELAGLEEMWRQAEEIAAIADRLPDHVD